MQPADLLCKPLCDIVLVSIVESARNASISVSGISNLPRFLNLRSGSRSRCLCAS